MNSNYAFVFDFEKLEVYQKAIRFTDDIFNTKRMRAHDYSISLSIPN